MRYDVRIDGHTIETFDTFEGANAQAEKLNGTLSLTAPDKKAIVIGDYEKQVLYHPIYKLPICIPANNKNLNIKMTSDCKPIPTEDITMVPRLLVKTPNTKQIVNKMTLRNKKV